VVEYRSLTVEADMHKEHNTMTDSRLAISLPERTEYLKTLPFTTVQPTADLITDALKHDFVALVTDVSAAQADSLVMEVSKRFSLHESLELQAGFAGFYGHRSNVGRYFMTVNKRTDYQFVFPHSEGTSATGMQLASFYCHENSTDGGLTILLRADDDSGVWQSLRELMRKVRPTVASVPPSSLTRARITYNVTLPLEPWLEADEVIKEHPNDITGVAIYDVLTRPRRVYSRILGQDRYALWDSMASLDFDLTVQYAGLLRNGGLLKEPTAGTDIAKMDSGADRHIKHSGVCYTDLFECKLTWRLAPGQLLIHNNLTWAHSASNWTPNSGTRNIVAAFA